MSTLKQLHRQSRTRRNGKPAFTLLELIVVLLVLGILAAIAVPTFSRVKENSVTRVAQTTLEAAARNGEAIARSNGDASDEQIAAAVESEFADESGLTVSVSGDTVTVTQVSGSITASGSVEFVDGEATITDAAVSGGGGGGGGGASAFAVAGTEADPSDIVWNAATQTLTYSFSNTTAMHRGLDGTNCAASTTTSELAQADLRTFAGVWILRFSVEFGATFPATTDSYPYASSSTTNRRILEFGTESHHLPASAIQITGTTTCAVTLDVAALKAKYLAAVPGADVSSMWFYIGDWRVNHDPVVVNNM